MKCGGGPFLLGKEIMKQKIRKNLKKEGLRYGTTEILSQKVRGKRDKTNN